jgi:hypothetical protein
LVKAVPNKGVQLTASSLCARLGFQQQLTPSVDMICIANDCAKRTCKTRLLAQGLRKSSDFLICMQGKT